MPKNHSKKITPPKQTNANEYDDMTELDYSPEDIPEFPDPSKETILGDINEINEYAAGGSIGSHIEKTTYTKAKDGYYAYVDVHDDYVDTPVPYKYSVNKEEILDAFAKAKMSAEKPEYRKVYGSADAIMENGVSYNITDEKFGKMFDEYLMNRQMSVVQNSQREIPEVASDTVSNFTDEYS